MKRQIASSHLTYEGRAFIETGLNEGKSVTKISNELGRDRSNISREILKHRYPIFPSSFNHYNHPCLLYNECDVKSYECYLNCKNIEINLCPKLTSSPHVCNGCSTKHGCRYVKLYYKAYEANCEYKNNWKEKRKGTHYTEEELKILNNDFYELVIKNKSIFHSITIINNRGFCFKINTIYVQIEKGQLRLKKSDLPRNRITKKKDTKEDKIYKRDLTNHTYEDYIQYKEKHPKANEMQMDTVEGAKVKDAPVILTLQIVKIHFLFMFKLDSQTINDVIQKLLYFKDLLSIDIFYSLFEILLTDNGKEFRNVELFTHSFKDLNIFYCHPYASYEKANIENNHELIRRVIPKGVSLKCYTQTDLDLLCSHINSLFRKDLDGKCPFDLIDNYIPLDVLSKLNLSIINAEDVMLVPELLGTKNVNNIKKYLDQNEIKKANIIFLNKNTK